MRYNQRDILFFSDYLETLRLILQMIPGAKSAGIEPRAGIEPQDPYCQAEVHIVSTEFNTA